MLRYTWGSTLKTPLSTLCERSSRPQAHVKRVQLKTMATMGSKNLLCKKQLAMPFNAFITTSRAFKSISHTFFHQKRLYTTDDKPLKRHQSTNKSGEASIALIETLQACDAVSASQIAQFKQLLSDNHDLGAEKVVSSVVHAFLSSHMKMSVSQCLEIVEAAISYYVTFQFLSQAEWTFYRAKSLCDLHGTQNIYEQLLTLSGRHKSKASIILAFKSWKKDFNLRYKHVPTEAVLDTTPILHIRGFKVDLDDSPLPSYVDAIQDEQHRATVLFLFCCTIAAASKAREIELAVQIFEEAVLVLGNAIPLFESMIAALCRANRVENAFRLLGEMHRRNIISFEAIHLVLSACGRLKNYHLAERLFYDIKATFQLVPTIATWNILLNVYILADDMEMAHERFVQLLKTKERTRPDLETYELMIPGHVRAKDLQRAAEMLKHAKANNIAITASLYAWIMEAQLHAKHYDEAFATVDEILASNLVLPQKFQNLLLRKCRRVVGLLDKYEARFGPAPEPVDDLKEIREQMEMVRVYEEEQKKMAKDRKSSQKKGGNVIANEEVESVVEDDAAKHDVQTPELEVLNTAPEMPLEAATTSQKYAVLEEVVEDDAEVSMEEWMKDDLGEDGWKDFSIPEEQETTPSGKKKKSRYATLVNLRYADVFKAAGWDKPGHDLDGAIERNQWEFLEDPFSRTRPDVLQRRKERERASAQIEAIQREVVDKIDAHTARSKLKQQRRRERAYGLTRKYIDDPKKKEKVRTDRAPAGSTFSFR